MAGGGKRRGRPPAALPPPTPSEAAFEALLASYRDNAPGSPPARPAVAEAPRAIDDPVAFIDDLFARSSAFLSREPYAGIADASGFNTKLVGVTFEGRQDMVTGLRAGDPLELQRQPDNPHDPNAIAVFRGALQVGFIKRDIAAKIAPNIDGGERYVAEVTAVTGGGDRSTGVNVYVSRLRQRTTVERVARGSTAARDVLGALIGDRELRDAQVAVLDRLEAGRNVAAILGTGRGKSLCFQYPAAVRALEHGEKTVVLYPLRALANDQYDALARRLGPLGVRIHRANGAIDPAERAALNDALETGAWDIICATPEFLTYHAERFGGPSRPAFVVVDEAHHLEASQHRAAYARLGATIDALRPERVLALTATAGDEAFARIRQALRIDAWVIDPTIRDNLTVIDARGTRDKSGYIERFIRDGDKAIVYCNSRTEATRVAETLRRAVGDIVAFYHAGVGTPERAQVEHYFRTGMIRVVVATSAFGEGIDLPDVRHVFLYHLNFDETEFNQQSGRAGRDGAPASIHLLFGQSDRNLNEFIIERGAPRLETLRAIYRGMKHLAGDGLLRMTQSDVAGALALDRVDGSTIGAATRIFADAGLVAFEDEGEGRALRFLPVSGRIDLTQNERFAEGEAERLAFATFCDLVLSAPASQLQTLIDRPIYPSSVPLRA